MTTHQSIARLFLSAAFTVLTVAGLAQAQCDVYRDGIPDFDQQRFNVPNNGLNYCVPTSGCNLLAYIAAHGDYRVFSFFGPAGEFQLQSHVAEVTSEINTLAGRMNTDANDGTNRDDARDGLQSLLNSRAPDTYTVSVVFGHIRAIDLYDKMSDGRMVMICYGFYQPDGSGRYSRNGGHCMALTGIADACGGSLIAKLRFRDPDDDGNLATQSTFTSRVSNAIQEVLPTSSGTIQRLQLTSLGLGSTTLRCLDTVTSIRAAHMVWPWPTQGLWSRAFLNGILTQVQGGLQQTYPTGNGRPIVGSVFAADGDTMFYTTTQPNPNAATPLYRQSVTDGTATLLLNINAPTPLATDRFGDLYFHEIGQIKRYDTSGATLVQLGGVTPNDGQMPDVLRWDDVHDQLVAITQSTRNLLLYSRGLALLATHPIPAGIAPEGTLCGDVDPPHSAYIVGSNASGFFYDLRVNPLAAALSVAQSVSISGVTGIRSLQVGDGGRLYVMTNVGEREFVRNASSGLWEPTTTPQFGSVPITNTMMISHGRDNYDPALYSGPAWRNVYVAEPASTSIRECPADQDMNGVVNVSDIFLYLQRFFNGSRAADFNVSGSATIQDIFDFLSAWFAGC